MEAIEIKIGDTVSLKDYDRNMTVKEINGDMAVSWFISDDNKRTDCICKISHLMKVELSRQIGVSEYYNNPQYYPYMPETVFNALEEAFLAGKETAEVPEVDFNTMLSTFQNGKQ